jgi:predicted nucleic acid-binding Zn ribbon protein
MPTYTYHCSKCDSQYERVQRITDAPDTLCPVPVGASRPGGRGDGLCGGEVRRVIVPSGGGGGFILKGGGWYRDGY